MKYTEFITPIIIKKALANTPQLTFEVTDACNLKCEYCGYGKFYGNYDERKSQRLSLENALKLIDYLVDLWNSSLNTSIKQNVYISFYGGEPLMNMPFITKIINYLENIHCPSRIFTFNMTTNGTLLNRYMDFLVEKRVRLLISLDGDRISTSYRIDHRGRNSYDRIVENIDKLRLKYPQYFEEYVNFNSVLHNRNNVQDIHSFFRDKYGKVPTIKKTEGNNKSTTVFVCF